METEGRCKHGEQSTRIPNDNKHEAVDSKVVCFVDSSFEIAQLAALWVSLAQAEQGVGSDGAEGCTFGPSGSH